MRSNAKEAVLQRRAVREARLRAELARMVDLLKRRPDVQQVYLAGSLASGQLSRHSDIDLVIIQQTDKRFLDRLDEFYTYLCPRVGTDLLVYTPTEWETLSAQRPFVRALRDQGQILYAA